MKPGIEIQGGERKGTKIKVPSGIRPTQSLLKRSLFDRLGSWIRGKRVLELFAGSGAVGFEALSRGAESVYFVEKSWKASRVIRENAAKLGYSEKVAIIKRSVSSAIKDLAQQGKKFDFIFADPPYDMKNLKKILEGIPLILENEGIFVLEIRKLTETPEIEGLEVLKEVKLSDSKIVFYGHISGQF